MQKYGAGGSTASADNLSECPRHWSSPGAAPSPQALDTLQKQILSFVSIFSFSFLGAITGGRKQN